MSGPHVLYIDDDEGLRRLVSRALSRRGYRVSLAGSGPEGVEMAREGRYDLVAVDHYMPGQDGLTTLAALRELPGCPPVVYVTGSEESSIAVAALKSGAEDYVVKTVGEDFFDLLARSFEHVLGAAALRRAKEDAEAQLRASNERLEALLQEVNHRVANNLQMIMAFVSLQSHAVPEGLARDSLQNTHRRIAAIAHVNRLLYTTGSFDQVEIAGYLGQLVSDLEATHGSGGARRTIAFTAEPRPLRTALAVSLGMIVSELVGNACKYAYEPDQSGEVRVSLVDEGAAMVLTVADDGAGMPDAAAPRGTGLGSKLIRALARTHDAKVETTPGLDGRGTVVAIRFPLPGGVAAEAG